MGCCGHHFHSKPLIREAIELNTLEFLQLNPQTKTELLKFRERAPRMDLRYGVCRNLIKINNQILCPLHPKQNQGLDLRKNHCDINHLCQTAKEFQDWDSKKQESFLQFIQTKNLLAISYSVQMDNNQLLQEFKSLQ